MGFLPGLLFVAALVWILIRTRRPAAKPRRAAPEGNIDSEAVRNLFDTAPIGYMEIDRNGIVRKVNRMECKLRGREQTAMLGVHCADLIPEMERGRYREQIKRKI